MPTPEEQMIEKLEAIRLMLFLRLNDSSADVSRIQADVEDMKKDIGEIRKLMEQAFVKERSSR